MQLTHKSIRNDNTTACIAEKLRY